MGSITLIVVSVVIPAAAWLINFIVRHSRGGPLTAGADWLLLLISFDAGAILTSAEFKRFVVNPDWQADLPAVFMFLAVVAIVAWMVDVMYLEPKIVGRAQPTAVAPVNLAQAIGRGIRGVVTSPMFVFLLSYVLLLAVNAAHVLLFIWKGPASHG